MLPLSYWLEIKDLFFLKCKYSQYELDISSFVTSSSDRSRSLRSSSANLLHPGVPADLVPRRFGQPGPKSLADLVWEVQIR